MGAVLDSMYTSISYRAYSYARNKMTCMICNFIRDFKAVNLFSQ